MENIQLSAMPFPFLAGSLPPSLTESGSTAAQSNPQPVLLLICGVFAAMVILCVLVSCTRPFRAKGSMAFLAVFLYLATVIVLLTAVFAFMICYGLLPADPDPDLVPSQDTTGSNVSGTTDTTEGTSEGPTVDTPDSTTDTTEPETEPAPTDPRLTFTPQVTDSSDPENFGINWEIIVDGAIVDSYQREDPINFAPDTDYFALPGVATFRGNNYRDDPTYGTVNITQEKLSTVWSQAIGSLDGYGGCCWTGQPLVVQWDDETKAIMNLYESKKNKENLVEVIYATLDGSIHFFDMDDGTKTRDPITVGMNFKGAGSLDPRGYPLLYVGSGYNTLGRNARMFIISLIDGSILYEAGSADPYSLRRDWSAFDSSPLVHAETDTLIWPGENGLLYTYRLNTVYDKEAGTISVSPDNEVKTRYSSTYSRGGRYLGYESSASIVNNYLYISENSGLFYCVDLNTMELVWAQDTLDDSNASPVFEWGENGEGYVYTAPSLHWTAYASAGTVSIYKLNAATGDILWQYSKDCVRDANISGGVQSTPILGREGTSIEGMVIYTIACTPSFYKGTVTALDTETGEVIWEVSSGNYAWSSPVPLYTEDGKAYIFFVNASGYAQILDCETGKSVSSVKLTGTTEASPVVFNNTIIIGTREKIYCLKVS